MDKVTESVAARSNFDQLERGKNDIAESLKKTGEAYREKAEDVKNKLDDKMKEVFHEVKEKASETQETVANYVKGNPLKSIGWAALAGAVIGALLRR